VEQAYSRYVTRWAPYLGTKGIQPLANDLDVDLAYRYRSAAVIPDGPDDGKIVEPTRETKARPGTRAPHFWLNPGQSTLDLFGRNFVLLAGPEGAAWREAAREPGVELDFHQISAAGFPEAYGITPSGAVLVRPDGMVGWRAQTAADASSGMVSKVLSALLGRRSTSALR